MLEEGPVRGQRTEPTVVRPTVVETPRVPITTSLSGTFGTPLYVTCCCCWLAGKARLPNKAIMSQWLTDGLCGWTKTQSPS